MTAATSGMLRPDATQENWAPPPGRAQQCAWNQAGSGAFLFTQQVSAITFSEQVLSVQNISYTKLPFPTSVKAKRFNHFNEILRENKLCFPSTPSPSQGQQSEAHMSTSERPMWHPRGGPCAQTQVQRMTTPSPSSTTLLSNYSKIKTKVIKLDSFILLTSQKSFHICINNLLWGHSCLVSAFNDPTAPAVTETGWMLVTHFRAAGLTQEWFRPPGYIWHYLEMTLVVTNGNGEVLLTPRRQKSRMLLNVLHGTDHLPTK